VHLVAFIIRIYHDARSLEPQTLKSAFDGAFSFHPQSQTVQGLNLALMRLYCRCIILKSHTASLQGEYRDLHKLLTKFCQCLIRLLQLRYVKVTNTRMSADIRYQYTGACAQLGTQILATCKFPRDS